MPIKQLRIKEDGQYKATVNINTTGDVIREWGDGDDIEKVIILNRGQELPTTKVILDEADIQQEALELSD